MHLIIAGLPVLGCLSNVSQYRSTSQTARTHTDNFRTCYFGNTLGGGIFASGNACNAPCPGDPTATCGGFLNTFPVQKRGSLLKQRQEIGGRILLTLYRVNTSSSVSLSSTSVTDVTERITSSLPPVIPSTNYQEQDFTALLPILSSTNAIRPQLNHFTSTYGNTRTVTFDPTTTTITVEYTIIDPRDRASLAVKDFYTTVDFYACNCAEQQYPHIAMTTFESSCDGCGPDGENTVTLTVPRPVVAAASLRGGNQVNSDSRSHWETDASRITTISGEIRSDFVTHTRWDNSVEATTSPGNENEPDITPNVPGSEQSSSDLLNSESRSIDASSSIYGGEILDPASNIYWNTQTDTASTIPVDQQPPPGLSNQATNTGSPVQSKGVPNGPALPNSSRNVETTTSTAAPQYITLVVSGTTRTVTLASESEFQTIGDSSGSTEGHQQTTEQSEEIGQVDSKTSTQQAAEPTMRVEEAGASASYGITRITWLTWFASIFLIGAALIV